MDGLPPAPKIWIAYSGGLDSSVLLHVAVAWCQSAKIPLHAIHVNHQLSGIADQWQSHCEATCGHLKIPCYSRKVNVNQVGKGMEDAARKARYKVFDEVLGDGELLLMAHHQDDQAETLLLRLLRGSGPRGLAAMPRQRPLGRGQLCRPFLDLPRHVLACWAEARGIDWIKDDSNQDERHDRNYLRHQVLPTLARRWPDCRTRFAHSARLCGYGASLLDDLAVTELVTPEAIRERRLSCQALEELPRQHQLNVLQVWLQRCGFPPPGQGQLLAVIDNLLPARADGAPLVAWGGAELRRYDGWVYGMASQIAWNPARVFPWRPGEVLVLPVGRLSARLSSVGGLREPGDEAVVVRFRRGGETCRLHGQGGSKSLKKVMQEYRIPPWLRDRIPLIYYGDRLAAIGDRLICDGFRCDDVEGGYTLCWETGFEIEDLKAF